MQQQNTTSDPKVTFLGALSVMVFLVVAVTSQVFVFDNSGAIHITLILVIIFASTVAMLSGYSWKQVQDGILHGCQIAMLPMLILMMVGVLISSWIAAGTIPAFIFYGMQLLSPEYFLFSACLICCLGSLATGSSWTTSATFGVAFMGIGVGLNISPAFTAGAVISGSIFGDKMSPLSDSTNLAAGIVGADLFEHIKSMIYSTGPAIILTLITFFIFGLSTSSDSIPDQSKITIILQGISNNYSLNIITFLPPLLVIVLAMKKFDGLLVMIVASLVAALIAITVQGASINQVFTAMNYGYTSDTGIAEIDSLLARGGLQSMMWTVSLGFIALGMGGLMEKTKMLDVLLEKIQKLVHSVAGLVTTHVISSILINIFAASQFIAIIIPGRMLFPVYQAHRLKPQVCSRVCEDSATVTSPLIPWGLGGVYYSSVLGVATLEYIPYTFLAFFAPMMTLLLAYTNKFMFKEDE
ncbi:MAG: Na+/H+ antiporter NhaC [Gammaproteobacteria bacterium]|nr:MAG: Na+/H+ antiporter NhaC [Gammaproteobacteria bacterium]